MSVEVTGESLESPEEPAASQASSPAVAGRISWRRPIAYLILTLLLGTMWMSAEGDAIFSLMRGGESIEIPDFTFGSAAVCCVLTLVGLLATVYAFVRAVQRKKIGVLPTIAIGVSAVLGLLAWYGGGSSSRITLTFALASGLASATPLIFGSLAGVVSERVGIVNIAIEGQLLAGAFVGVVVASWWQSVWLGLIAAPAAGAIVGALLAFFAIKYNVDQIIVGVVLNVLVIGLTTFFLGTEPFKTNKINLNSSIFHLDRIAIPGLSDIPVLGPVLFDQTALTYFMYALIAALTVYLYRSKWGLRLRACGEHPKAAATVGINVRATRFRNSLLAGAIAGLGGAYLTIAADIGHEFNDKMSSGKGYIALAAMILGKWNPIGAVGAALMFGFAEATAILLPTLDSSAPANLINMIPYVITILAVAGFVGKSRPPAAENKPY